MTGHGQTQPTTISFDEWPFVQVPTALLADNELSDGSKVTFSMLLLFQRRSSHCWPGNKLLAKLRGVNVATVKRHVKQLEAKGWLERYYVSPAGIRVESPTPGVDRRHIRVHQCAGGQRTSEPRDGAPLRSGGAHQCATEREPVEREALNKKTSRKRSEESKEDFDRWWSLWPHKKGKGQARKAYAKALKLTDPATLYAALDRQLAHLKDQKARGFCPHPATWLNGERWEDEPDGPVVSDRFSELDPDDWTGR